VKIRFSHSSLCLRPNLSCVKCSVKMENTMKKLLVYLKDYKKESVLGPLFKLLEATFELIVPLVMAAIIDTGVATGDKSYIMKMCMVLVLLAVIGLTCSVTAQYFAAKAAVGFATKLRHALFAHIESLSFTEMDTVGTATLITRMTSDVNQVQNGVNLVLRLFLRSPFIVFGAMVMAFTIDVKAALVFVVTIPLLSIIVFGIMLISIPLYKKVQSALDKVLGITRENLTGSRVIRAFNKEDDEKVHFNENNDLLTRAQIYVGKISALMNPLTYVIINGAIVVLVWTGAVRVDNGYITQGEVVALINYMSQILVELVKLANLIININKSIACGNRIQSIFEMQPSITDGSGQKVDKVQTDTADRSEEAEYAVEFSHVGLTYAGAGDESLTDIDFKVKKGETIGIIGGTGSGKSSVVNLIPRFYDVTSGFIKVDGKDVKDYPLEELRGKIGTVLQKAVLFHGTIRENLKWGNPDATEEDLNRAITVAQAKEFVDNKEGRLDFEIEQGGKNLSGGQRQRLTIARAVVKKPEILILDDSASALDFATDAALRKAIREMEGETTVFIVSQRAASIQHADRIVVLDDGKIVGLGTSEELLESCEVYQEIYNSQFKKQEGGKTA
jgi:ATP-binding cassette subfamily B multidrug efflux pump